MSESEADPEGGKESSAEYSDEQTSEIDHENNIGSDEEEEDAEDAGDESDEEEDELNESDVGVEEQEGDEDEDDDDNDEEHDEDSAEGEEDDGEVVGAVKIPNGHEADSGGAEDPAEPSDEDQKSEVESEDDDIDLEKSDSSSSPSAAVEEFEDGSIAAEAVDADVANRNNCM